MKTNKQLTLNHLIISFIMMGFFSACEEKYPETDVVQNSEKIVADKGQLKLTSFTHELAKRWAPINRQDVDATGDHGLGGKCDYITAINFDGDWVATNNWDNIASSYYEPTAHCYYSVTETSTHWFILYAFFHPRDWTDIFFLYGIDEHENDLEGVLLVVTRDGSTYGDLQAAVTVYHSDFYSYLESGSYFEENYESADGTLIMETYNGELHPVVAQESKGHGLKAYPDIDIDGDGVIYYPSMNDIAEAPSDNYDTDVKYKLVDIFEDGGLWDQRYNTSLFESPTGGFLSSEGDGNANPPWNWNDNDDDLPTGYLANYPASLVAEYFTELSTYSFLYTSNDYVGTILSEGAYRIAARHSGKLLDVSENSSADGANIIQWENNGNDNQIWRIWILDENYYKIESKSSGKVMDVYNASTDDGANIVQWEYSGGDHQKWTITETDPGYYNFASKLSGKVIDIDGASTANGANVWQWTLNGGNNQQFQLHWASSIYY